MGGAAGGFGLMRFEFPLLKVRGKKGETSETHETDEEFALFFSNSILIGLTGLPDRTPFHIERLVGGKLDPDAARVLLLFEFWRYLCFN